MAAIDDLIRQVADESLRRQLQREAEALQRQKKFGLVYEQHIPESVQLPGIDIRRGSIVARRDGDTSRLYRVESIEKGQALCRSLADGEEETIATDELVAVARFGEAVYPYLQPIDSISTAEAANPWHTLIEADNYHALQLLDYLYRGQVDCIYIDPPYNTGARDWKYNNDYVDAADQYRHSKWLSMMEKRLRIAKRLLNPKDSVLIVTIDEKEYLHLGCLLEEMFPEAHIQKVSIVINPNGVARQNEMYRLEEYAFYVYIGSATPALLKDPLFTSGINQRKQETAIDAQSQQTKVRWEWLLRGGSNSDRVHSPGCFYPVYIDPVLRSIADIGWPLPPNEHPSEKQERDGLVAVWPIARGTGAEKVWQLSRNSLIELVEKGLAKVGAYDRKRDRWTLLYLGSAQRERLNRGELIVTSRDANGVAIVEQSGNTEVLEAPRTIWNRQAHSAGEYGSRLIRAIVPGREFAFPKSIYATKDAINCVVKNKPDALIVDFFAGSGTTLHAVNLLNKEDGGRRRCIMVTNNEVSNEEASRLKQEGFRPGDAEWERLGIARYVTWPRTTCSILGKDINGKPIKGEYLTYLTEEKTHRRSIRQLNFYIPQGADGTRLKKQIAMLIGKDKLPQSKVTDAPFVADEDCSVAILFDDHYIAEWLEAIEEQEQLRELYIVTQNSRLFSQAKAKIEETLGDYTTTEPLKYAMADGFRANVEFFKLGFLDKNAVSLGRQFRELLPLLWLKAGAKGRRPEIAEGDDIPPMLIAEDSGFAVLTDETRFGEFAEQMEQHKDVAVVFIVTDSAAGFNYMNNVLPGRQVVQLYKNYLDNFTINQAHNVH